MKEEFKGWKIYNSNLAAVAMERKQVRLNKPRYVGSAILAISKTLMYEFHFKYMMPTFPGSKVIFTDTDSLCYIIPDLSNVHEVIKGSKRFDFSNFPQNHPNYCGKYKMTPGKFKDECPYSTIVEVVGHRSKMYSILKIDGENMKAANGVCSNVKKECYNS